MTENILVTIMMPAYNHELYVEEAITSLLEQTYPNIEFIIINDGSTDNTHDIIMKYYNICENKFTNFKYITRLNKGLLPTLKEMEPLITGKYFSLLYSDDIFNKDRISMQVKIMEENKDYALSYGKMLGIDEKSNVIKKYKAKYCKSGNVFDELLLNNFVTAPTVMMKTAIFNEIGGYDLSFEYDDYPLWLKIAHKHKIYFIDEYLVYYRTHGDNLSGDLYKTITTTEKILLSWKNENGFSRAINFFYLKSFYELVRSHYDYNKYAKEYMIKASKSWYHPRYIKAFIKLNLKNYTKKDIK